MRTIFVFLTGVLCSTWLGAQEVNYKIYTSTGKKVELKKVAKKASKADVVLFGELHDDSICHSVQLELFELLLATNKTLALGLEMLEADNQVILDEYQQGLIAEKYFNRECRLWPNYATDYAPIVNKAIVGNVPVIATNVPRRYASTVAQRGDSALLLFSEMAQTWMAPIPFPFDPNAPGYAEMMQMDFGHSGETQKQNMVKAQALKDATMAYFIGENLPRKGVFYHLQGDFHSANQGGIGWYLKAYAITEDIVVLSTVQSESLAWDESWAGRADYILVTSIKASK